jgi:hypothetical protein
MSTTAPFAPLHTVGTVLPDGRTVVGYVVVSEHKNSQSYLPCENPEWDFYGFAKSTAAQGRTAYYRLFYKLDHPVLDRQFARALGIKNGEIVETDNVCIPTGYY